MKVKVKFVLTIFLTTTIFCKNIVGQSINSMTQKTSIDSFIERKMNETGIVGIGAAIIVDKKLVWTKGYGYANKENKILFTPSTIMNIASISKTFSVSVESPKGLGNKESRYNIESSSSDSIKTIK